MKGKYCLELNKLIKKELKFEMIWTLLFKM